MGLFGGGQIQSSCNFWRETEYLTNAAPPPPPLRYTGCFVGRCERAVKARDSMGGPKSRIVVKLLGCF